MSSPLLNPTLIWESFAVVVKSMGFRLFRINILKLTGHRVTSDTVNFYTKHIVTRSASNKNKFPKIEVDLSLAPFKSTKLNLASTQKSYFNILVNSQIP